MKNKFNLMIAGIFAFVFLISLASAALTISDSTVTFNDNSQKQITVSSNESGTISLSSDFLTIKGLVFNITGDKTLDSNNQTILTITPEGNIRNLDFDEEFSDSFDITLGSETKTVKVEVLNEDICRYDNVGNDLRLDIRSVDVINGYGDDEEWFPLDEVEVEIRIENRGNDDIDDIELEWGIYDSGNKEWIIELDEFDDFDLRDGDREDLILTFTLNERTLDVDFDDLRKGSYELYVRATGEINNNNDRTCRSESETVEIIIERDFVTLHDLEMPESVQCNTPLQISGEVWNIGDRDQDDVRVRIQNSDLGINEFIDIGDIDEFDSEPFSVNFELPDEVSAGTYFLHFAVLDEDGDIYEARHDDQRPSFSQSITVTGDCTPSEASVSAVLESGGEAGEELTVRTTITNTGSKTSTYILNAEGYSSWASSARFEQSTITINAGESKEVLVTLDVKDDVEGEKIFNVEILSDGELIATQPVSVNIEPKSGLSITGFAINNDNWHLWGIGLLNLILVIAIIIIAVRIMRKK